MDTVTILGTTINNISQSQVLAQIEQYIQSKQPHYIVTANAEIIHRASRDQQMQRIINNADIVTPDGSGVIWAAKYLGHPLTERVTGIDLVHAICHHAQKKQWRIFILGAAPGIAQQATLNIIADNPACQIVGCHHGYIQEPTQEQEAIDQIIHAKPHILLVAMGAPAQEIWITKHLHTLNIPVSIGIGGSLDVISGNLKRAPKWMQKLSLEWLYRILIQPSRWKRALALPKFVITVLTTKK